ncbi:MAG: bifunctional phosphopantothenoylcysteine decarboxylase/phosphopantothenate--cysteine ligase CoaBC [bacterium]
MRIVLGITGSVAAYKGAELARIFVRSGHEVRAVITAAGQRFVTPMLLQALTGHPVPEDQWETLSPDAMGHIKLAQWGDCMVVAPASADYLAKAAAGIADDLLSTVTVAFDGPKFFAPAMNTRMFENPATQGNLETLSERGIRLVAAQEGDLACGERGAGKMAEPEQVAGEVRSVMASRLDFSGIRALVTAGPTEEALDSVRIITNRSTGRMGFALAEALAARGARVQLVTGPTPLEPPGELAETIRVRSTGEMAERVRERFGDVDLLIMAAAVADWRPAREAGEKTHRSEGPMHLDLEPTEDILEGLKEMRAGQVMVGFALEEGEAEKAGAAGRAKLERKGLDLIAVNDPTEEGAGPEAETNHLLLVHRDGRVQDLPMQTKRKAAHDLLDAVRPYLDGAS